MSLAFSSSHPIIQTTRRLPTTTDLLQGTRRYTTSSSKLNLYPNDLTSPLKSQPGVPYTARNGGRPMRIKCEVRDDGFYMRRAVELARRALGHTSPNPMVGCVIVKDGEIVGEGFHPKAGQPHAEVFALRDAGTLAENATAYVSLEPCNHYGRTPPCTEALINAKVKRVVVGMVDPNPIVASKGVDKLRQSGIDVLVGVEEILCRKLNEAYIHRMVTGKPFVTLRYTLSMNGRVLNQLGDGAEEAGGYYSRFLQEYDGVVVSHSSSCAVALPMSEESGSNQPLQILITRTLDSSVDLSSIAKSSASKVVVFTEKANTDKKVEGVEIVLLEKLNFSSTLDACAKLGLCSLLVDYRGDDDFLAELLENGLEEGLLQKVAMEVCPEWIRNKDSSVLNFGDKLLRLRNFFSRISKESVLVEAYIS